MKKLALLAMILLLAFAPVSAAYAEETEKTVDGSGDRWEQESSNAASLATMTWDQEADTLHFSGKGYKDRIGMKFGFRCKIAFDTDDLSVTVQFPETFQALYSEDNNMHYVISLVNTYSRWWNTDGNDVKSAAFIVRPQAQDTISVELAGRWGLGSAGYGDISGAEKTEFKLGEDRTMQFGFKKDGEVYGAYIDGELFATFEKELKDGNTMSDYIAQYNENKGYLQFGATLENDKDDVELSYTLTHMSGALDAFAEPETPPDDGGDTEAPPVQQGSEKTSDFNWKYVVLYGIGGAAGIAALVCYLISGNKRT